MITGLTGYVIFPPAEGGLTPHAVDALAGLWDETRASDALVGSGDATVVDAAQRRSRVQWIGPDSARDVFSQLFTLAKLANERCGWQFELSGMSPALQLTEYDAARQGHYDWHIDLGRDETARRKISLVALLSDPATCSGGHLQLLRARDADTLAIERGSVVAFPSYLLHRVTPLFEGTRRSLVGWACGDTPFR